MAFQHHNTEGVIVVVILGILAAIAVPAFLNYRESGNRACIENLSRMMAEPLPEGSVCPKSRKAYAPGDRLACPSPEGHLPTEPRLIRTKAGWQMTQTLPPVQGKPLQIGKGSSEVKESPGRVSIHTRPAAFVRYFVGPLFLLIMTLVTIMGLVWLGIALRKKEWNMIVLPVIIAGLFGTLAWYQLKFFTSSVETIVERGRVVRIDYELGKPVAQAVTTGVLGFVPMPAVWMRPSQLYLVQAPGRASAFDTIPGDRFDIVTRLNQILEGP